MDKDTSEKIYQLVRRENIRMNELLEAVMDQYGESGAVSICINVSINLIAQALLVVDNDHRKPLMEMFADEVAERVKSGIVQVEADYAIRKAKGEV
jgi:hypothetical protein